MQGNPYWLNAKYSGKCSKCKQPFNKGAFVFYYPRTKDIFYERCAKLAEKDFTNMVEQEESGLF